MNKKFKLLMLLPLGITSLLGAVRNEASTMVSAADVNYDTVITTQEEFDTFMSEVSTSGEDVTITKNVSLKTDVSLTLPETVASYAAFGGVFNGNNHTITLSSATNEVERSAMFHYMTGTFKNTIFEGSVTGATRLSTVCIYNLGGLIENVTSYVNFNSTGLYSGTICAMTNDGSNSSERAIVKNCVNYGDFTVTNKENHYCGGIVGYTYQNSSIIDCTNYGNISGVAGILGGITGYTRTTTSDKTTIVKNCKNYGDVTSGSGHLGGIVGWTGNEIEFINCDNYGDIETTSNFGAGGIAGTYQASADSSYLKIANCYNGGNVRGRYIGGILGHIDGNSKKSSKVNFINTITAGNVTQTTGSGYVGQFCGNGKSTAYYTLTNCYTLNKYSYLSGATNVYKFMGSSLYEGDGIHDLTDNNGVSDNVRAYIQAVRDHNCENTEATQQKLLATQSSSSLSLIINLIGVPLKSKALRIEFSKYLL